MTSQQADNIRQALELAVGHHQAGRVSDAEIIYKQVLLAEPDNEHANHFLGIIASQAGKNNLAVQFISKAIEINPAEPSYLMNLGNVYIDQIKPAEAEMSYRKALAIRPDYPDALYNLGNALRQLDRFDESAASFQKAIDLKPDYAKAHNGKGVALREQGRLDEAVASYRQALAIESDYAEAFNNLGNVLQELGSQDEAIINFRKALLAAPDFLVAHSNLLYALNYHPETTQEDFFAEAQKWDRQFARPLAAKQQTHVNSRDRNRKLRIGYVSPDFRTHPVSSFFEPFLNARDRQRFEVYLYSNVMKTDLVTQHLQTETDHWLSIVGIEDEGAADLIRQDRIDILVDLAGHTANNRLLVFAGKPAPIQVSWLGYPNTTGLSAIDYRLTDAIADPVGETDRLHSEQLIRLEHGFLCYQPDSSAPDVAEPPCLIKGHITFGSFNNLTKVTPEVVKAWSEILQAVPGSRLVMKSKQLGNEKTRVRYLEMFGKQGIASERIELIGWLPEKESHLGLYHGIDIALDPFPYNGTTTTCEALWMGVPMVTMLGNRHSGRVGASILTRIGLTDFIADSEPEYTHNAVALAEDHGRLSALRDGMRQRIIASPLYDVKAFTKSIEEAYCMMWDRYVSEKA